MSNANLIAQLRRRLLELGCPPERARKITREAAEHYEDLLTAARAKGVSEAEAAAGAAAQFGEPATLAEQHVSVIRGSSWWGRHPRWGFGVLPLLLAPMCWILFWCTALLLVTLVGRLVPDFKVGASMEHPAVFASVYLFIQLANLGEAVVMCRLFIWLARRGALSFNWMAGAGIYCFLNALFSYVQVEPHAFALGYNFSFSIDEIPVLSLNWAAGFAAVLVLLVTCARQQRELQKIS